MFFYSRIIIQFNVLLFYPFAVSHSEKFVYLVSFCLIAHLHSALIPGSNPGGGSDPSCRISLTCVYTVILLKEQTLQAGKNE